MPSVMPVRCRECVRLLDAYSAADRLVRVLLTSHSEAASSEPTQLLRLIEDALVTARRDRDHASQELEMHRQEHGCTR